MPRKKISTTVYLTPAQVAALQRLSDRTKAPVAAFIREGVDFILGKYAEAVVETPHEGAAVS